MKYNQIVYSPAAVSTTGFAASVTGAAFTLTTNLIPDSMAHKITILNNTVTDHSAKTLTIVGLDADGIAQTETIAAPGVSATVTSAKYYSYLTSVTPSATIGADTFSIGWAAASVGKTLPINWRRGQASIDGKGTGVYNYDIQQTYDDIQFKTPPFSWNATSFAAAVSTGFNYTYMSHPKAIRILFNSYTGTPSVTLSYTQLDY